MTHTYSEIPFSFHTNKKKAKTLYFNIFSSQHTHYNKLTQLTYFFNSTYYFVASQLLLLNNNHLHLLLHEYTQICGRIYQSIWIQILAVDLYELFSLSCYLLSLPVIFLPLLSDNKDCSYFSFSVVFHHEFPVALEIDSQQFQSHRVLSYILSGDLGCLNSMLCDKCRQ